MTTPLRAILADDEPLARSYLRELLAAHPEVTVLAECRNGLEAARAIAQHRPDLAFLDVEMPKAEQRKPKVLRVREVVRITPRTVVTRPDPPGSGAQPRPARAWAPSRAPTAVEEGNRRGQRGSTDRQQG